MFINVGKNVIVNTDEIAYCCTGIGAPVDLLSRAIDISGGSKRTFIALTSKMNILVDLSVQMLLSRINGSIQQNAPEEKE